MRLVTYCTRDGCAVGDLRGGFVYDLQRCAASAGGRSAGAATEAVPRSVRALIGDGEWLRRSREAFAAAGDLPREQAVELGLATALAEVTLDLPVPDAAQYVCVARNYRAHATESGKELVDRPALFLRVASSLARPGEAIVKPVVSDMLDWEGELAVVIGKPCRHVTVDEALSAVGGYACFNDGSVRDWQRASPQWTAGKNFYKSGSFGPCVTTADEVPGPQELILRTLLNGEVMQQAGTDEMIFSVAEIISYISQYTELVPGDVIATGTPAGVGTRRTPPRYLDQGDVIEVEVEGVGRLSNGVDRERPAQEPDRR
jgi:2-keto-4-pentenoate hydratase/2-oxohepta-3-ene-1,7-dioic acid hydratase in catechol pathway